MKKLNLKSARELKPLVKNQRKDILQINQLCLGEIYPLIQVSNSHVIYYDIDEQGYKPLTPPFNVLLKKPGDVFFYIIAIYFKEGTEYYNSSNVDGNYTTNHIENAELFDEYEHAYRAVQNELQLLAFKKGWSVRFDIRLILS